MTDLDSKVQILGDEEFKPRSSFSCLDPISTSWKLFGPINQDAGGEPYYLEGENPVRMKSELPVPEERSNYDGQHANGIDQKGNQRKQPGEAKAVDLNVVCLRKNRPKT